MRDATIDNDSMYSDESVRRGYVTWSRIPDGRCAQIIQATYKAADTLRPHLPPTTMARRGARAMPDDFGQRLPYLMRRVSNALSQRLERTLKDFSLNHAKLAALAQLGLCHPDGLLSAELGHRTGVTAQSMSAAVATLLEQGFVTRAPHPDHGRMSRECSSSMPPRRSRPLCRSGQSGRPSWP